MTPLPSDRDDFQVADLFSPGDAHADPRSQLPASEPATRPSVGGAPASFSFTNPLLERPRDPRAAGSR